MVCHPAYRAVYAAFVDLCAGVEHHFQKPRHRRPARLAGGHGHPDPNWMAYGYFPIVTIMVLHYAPLVILIVGNALKRMDSQMEECARVLGASRGESPLKSLSRWYARRCFQARC
jgi:hypothetical protein